MTILVGTAAWTDKSLIDSGKFYPSSAKDAATRLRYYASQFRMVEVDSSYYAIPAPAAAQLWAERTPKDFVFNVKAFRLFTGHQTQPKVFPKDIQNAIGRPLTENIYYRELSAAIQQEAIAVPAEHLQGRVVSAADGDTIMVLDASYQQHKVCLNGIDAAKKGQPFGDVAKRKLSALVFDKHVSVEWHKHDSTGA